MDYPINHYQKIRHRVIVPTILLLLFTGCIEKSILPDSLDQEGDFSAGDTSYLQISPIWNATNGLHTPVDLSIAPDGHVFVADPGNHSIVVLDQGGSILPGFEVLSALQDTGNIALSPIDVDIDNKLNVFFIDGTQRVFRWNQYWNDVGIDSVLMSAVFIEDATGVRDTAEYGSVEWGYLVNDPGRRIIKHNWEANQDLIDALLAPHIFYDANMAYNQALDVMADSLPRLTAISVMGDNSNYFVVGDEANDRLYQINFYHYYYIMLTTGQKVWGHIGLFGRIIVADGAGAGFANNPQGIDVAYDNNIYYSQFGGNYLVNNIKRNSSGGYVNAFTNFSLNILDLKRFSQPLDVAVDDKKMIYVSNTGGQEIQVFNADGSFFRKAGVEIVTIDTSFFIVGEPLDTTWIDTSLWVIKDGSTILVDTSLAYITYDSVEVDSFFQREVKGTLFRPAGITVDERGVIYVCEPSSSSILRFRLSNVLDDDLTPQN
ncbi:MAG: hypothetical protein ABIA75_14145 [Candidatus Neomarinimicrobiota bacterium]